MRWTSITPTLPPLAQKPTRLIRSHVWPLVVVAILALVFEATPALAQVAVRIPDKEWDVYSAVMGSRGLWITEGGNLHLIENGDLKSFSKDIPYINSLSYLNGEIWLATRKGAFKMNGDTPIRMSEERVVRRVEMVGQEIWLATGNGAYPLATHKRTPDQEVDVQRIEQINGEIWLATRTGAFRTDRKTLTPIGADLHLNVHAIKSINGQIWLGTETGLYTFDGKTVTRLFNDNHFINDIAQIDGKIWLCTLQGVYSVDSNGLKPLLYQELDVKEIQKIGGKIWLGASSHPNQRGGIYRVDEDVSISIKPGRSWLEALLQDVLRRPIWIEGVIKPEVQYSRHTQSADSSPDDVPMDFDVILTSSKVDFDKADKNEHYSPASSFERYLKAGRTTIYMRARDKWGNKSAPETVGGWVIPNSFFLLPVLAALLWWALLILILFLAPYNKFCMQALMNPFLRTYLSFGFVPLIITLFPVARRHLLKTYLREISRDKEFASWQKRFVLPDEALSAEGVAEHLRKNNILFLVGESGIGKTSYFKYLLGYYGANKKRFPHLVPVLLPLRRHQGVSPKEIFTDQLATYGCLTDEKLTEWFLTHGSFLILIDGLNEVDEQAFKTIVGFVYKLRKVNSFFLSSQETYVDFEDAETLTVPTLDAEQIKQILRNRLGDKAEATIARFDDDIFKEYGIPQELDLAIDLVKQGKPLPPTRLELYEATLEPIFAAWSSKGFAYERQLCGRAYEMLSKGESSFETAGSSMSTEIRDSLRRAKLLTFRGGQYQFRHDLIRAYLAAKYLAPRWGELLDGKEPVRLDANWNSTIKFITLVYDNTDDRKKLLFWVLKKNSQVAKEVFNWLEKEHPQLVEDWSDEFDTRYGKTMRTVISVGKSRPQASHSR
jgi:energy-coupling factor transporter ATP-binding protein EcfA2